MTAAEQRARLHAALARTLADWNVGEPIVRASALLQTVESHGWRRVKDEPPGPGQAGDYEAGRAAASAEIKPPPPPRPTMPAEPRDGDDCPACWEYCFDNPGLAGACASVGIERGKSTGEMLHDYLADYHSRGHRPATASEEPTP